MKVEFASFRDMVKEWQEQEGVSDTSRCVVIYQKISSPALT
jgi:hypothetical protein